MKSLWLQKFVLLDLYRRLILDLAYEKIIIRGYLVVFCVSYVAVEVVTFTECRPFRLYTDQFQALGDWVYRSEVCRVLICYSIQVSNVMHI